MAAARGSDAGQIGDARIVAFRCRQLPAQRTRTLTRPPRDRLVGIAVAHGVGTVAIDAMAEAVALSVVVVAAHSGFIPGGSTMAKDKTKIENLVTFQLGDLEGEGIALVLGYSTSQEKLSRGEIESFAVGMTKQKAAALGRALLAIAGKAPSGGASRRKGH
jgi:hypothetical protein